MIIGTTLYNAGIAFKFVNGSEINEKQLTFATCSLAAIAICCVGKSIAKSKNSYLKVQLLGATLLNPLSTIMRIEFLLFKHGFLLAKSGFYSSQNLLLSSLKATLIFAGCMGTAFGIEYLFIESTSKLSSLKIPFSDNLLGTDSGERLYRLCFGLSGYFMPYPK